jgi:hypothetical protein
MKRRSLAMKSESRAGPPLVHIANVRSLLDARQKPVLSLLLHNSNIWERAVHLRQQWMGGRTSQFACCNMLFKTKKKWHVLHDEGLAFFPLTCAVSIPLPMIQRLGHCNREGCYCRYADISLNPSRRRFPKHPLPLTSKPM